MKINTLLCLMLLTTTLALAQLPDVKNFVVTENPNSTFEWGDHFHFNFDIKGNYGYDEIRLRVHVGYKTTATDDDSIGYSRWNREGDNYLNFSNYTNKVWWNGWSLGGIGAPPYSISGKTFTLMVEYEGVRKFLYYTVPNSDSDGDGVPDNQDNCPNQAGPSSNNGCPGHPDLKVENETSMAFSACQSCQPWLDTFLSSGKRHLIAGGAGSLSFNKLQIRNIGNTTSNSALVDFYFSTNNTLEETTDQFLKSVSIPSRTANSPYGFQTSINGWDLFSSCPECASNNGNYFIIALVDGSNTNNEGTNGEANNILSIPITYNSSATATSRMTTTNVIAQEYEAMPYTINIYDFKGQKIATKEVTNREGENAATLNLLKGIYIIKSIKGDRKVYID